ncbi:MAG TPA: peptidoglycan-binding protein [Cyanobacteria bacterium UBA11372]|nr:peptidoglycan-binding protein [Cyanobacteria bacterium UBA11372]
MQSLEQEQTTYDLPTLKLGSKGEAVKYLQEILIYYGYKLKVDGIFGAKTEVAVKQFQKSRKLKVDGIVGPATWSALLADYNPGC